MTIKNLRLCPAIGGYIVKYDLHEKVSNDDYDSERYVGEKIVVATDADEAIKLLDELFLSSADSEDTVMELPHVAGEGDVDLMKHT